MNTTFNPEDFHNVFEPLRREGLHESERRTIRDSLVELMKTHPARVPFLIRVQDFLQHALQRFSIPLDSLAHSLRMQVSFATVLFVLVGGFGTSYAAEHALPGEMLYPIKIHINEPIQGALQTTPEAKAEWSEEIATRRLEEAETLAAKGTLTPAIQDTLTAQIDQATERFSSDVAELSTSQDNATIVAAAVSNMQATLDVHAQVLNQISDVVPQSREAVEPILVHLEAHSFISLTDSGDQSVATSTAIASTARASETRSSTRHASASVHAAEHVQSGAYPAPSSDTISIEETSAAIHGESTTSSPDELSQFSARDEYERELRAQVAEQIRNETGVVLPIVTASTTIEVAATSTPNSPPTVLEGILHRLHSNHHYPHGE